MLGDPIGRARRAGEASGDGTGAKAQQLSEGSPTLPGMADDGVPLLAPPEPAAPSGEDAGARRRSLSPSRAGDFLTCPLLYRFRVIDRLPEPPSPAAARGTLVHAVLEHLFDRPAPERTPEVARSLLDPE
ncbi:MAG: RecB family exonuclease, partial [Streptosporangiaceae bacterium]